MCVIDVLERRVGHRDVGHLVAVEQVVEHGRGSTAARCRPRASRRARSASRAAPVDVEPPPAGRLEAHVDQLACAAARGASRRRGRRRSAPVVDHDHAPRHLLDVGDVVRGEEDRRAALLVQAQIGRGTAASPPGRGRWWARRGTAPRARAAGWRPARSASAGPATGSHRPVEQLGGVEQLAELGDPRRRLGRSTGRRSAPSRSKVCARRQLEPQLRALPEQRADARRQLRAARCHGTRPSTVRRAAGRVQDAGQHLDRGRLAGAVRADVREPLSGRTEKVMPGTASTASPPAPAAAGRKRLSQLVDADAMHRGTVATGPSYDPISHGCRGRHPRGRWSPSSIPRSAAPSSSWTWCATSR